MRKTSCKNRASEKTQVSCGFLVAIFSIAATINFLTEPAKAGCNQGKGEAAIYSTSDRRQVSYIGDVELYECGNSSGSFGGLQVWWISSVFWKRKLARTLNEGEFPKALERIWKREQRR